MACKRCASLHMVCFADRWDSEKNTFRSFDSFPVPSISMMDYAEKVATRWVRI